jgi:hypothetical protein
MSPLSHNILWLTKKSDDLSKELHFDITRPDPHRLQLFMHFKSKQEIQVWSFDMNQDSSVFRDTMITEAFRRYWKNEANYQLASDGYFSALTSGGKSYVVLQDGTVYRLDGKTAEVVKRLPGRLESGTLIVNKDTDEVHFLPATGFRQNRSLAESVRLEGIKILPE